MNSIWIAREKDGLLYAYKSKPFFDKDKGEWCSYVEGCLSRYAYRLSEDWFPDLTFENSPVELVIKEIRKSCSNCQYFEDEAIDGTGICHAFKTEHFYNDEGCYDWERKEV